MSIQREMPGRGLEPLILSEPDPKSGVSANFTTLAYLIVSDLHLKCGAEVASLLFGSTFTSRDAMQSETVCATRF